MGCSIDGKEKVLQSPVHSKNDRKPNKIWVTATGLEPRTT